MDELLKKLNEEQIKPVCDTEGAVLVLAGAGSGKTRVLTSRIAYILENGLASPRQILAITFTNKAAAEMKERVRLVCGDTDDMWICTIHSMCVRILRRYTSEAGIKPDFSIYSETERKNIIKKCLKELDYDDEKMLKNCKYHIGNAKMLGLEPDQYARRYADENKIDDYVRVYRQYEEHLKENNALDFDDLLLYARRLLFNAAYQKRAGEIIKLVESGITSILDRKSHQIEAYKRSVVYHMKELGASIAVVFLIALMWIWYGMKKVSQPLRETTLFAHRVAEGEAESSIAVSGHDEIAELRAMLNVMLSSLQKNALMLRELSYIDPLTALWNRRRFREVLSDELRRVQEEKGKGFGLAFIDVDCFKGINDTFGHAAGDMVLREFAKLARGMLPDSATFARLGGDEFVLLLPDADEGALFRQLEEIRVACTAKPLVHADREVRFSISAGGYRFTSSGAIDTPEENEKTISDLFRYADSALYMSKQAGRDRVTLWSPDCSFPCAESRWKEQSVSDDVC